METAASILLAVLGIGFLVFIHETGHFLAARWCGVHVHVFSLGFGPRVFGFVKHGCDYRLSLVPVGGYVRMEGEMGDGDDTDAAGSLSRKTPLQRIFVYSAGVMMNFIVAFVLFPIAFYFGVPVVRPVVGYVSSGSPAWYAGILPGTVIRSLNGIAVDSFDHLATEVALASSPVKLQLDEPVVGAPGQFRGREIECVTALDPSTSMPKLGVGPSRKVDIYKDLTDAPRFGYPIEVEAGSPAYEAGVRDGDLLIAVDGITAGYFTGPLFEEKLDAQGTREATWTFRCRSTAGRPPERVQSLEKGVALTPRTVSGSERPLLGVFPMTPVVKSIRPGGAAERMGLRAKDEILTVQGAPFLRSIDLVRGVTASSKLTVEVLREGVMLRLAADLGEAERSTILTEIQLDTLTTRVGVVPGLAGDLAGIRSGDRIVRIADKEVREWPDILKAVSDAGAREVKVELDSPLVASDGIPAFKRLTTNVKPLPAPAFDFGLRFVEDKEELRAAGPLDAIAKGFGASVKFIKQIAYFLKKIALGDVPAKESLGGPISIAAQSFNVAQSGTIQFLYFLGILSLNLALINILPIPVLDGGNIFFVVVEAVKGSPVSDRVLGASQTVGVFLLIALMVWVTFHDVRRVFGIFS